MEEQRKEVLLTRREAEEYCQYKRQKKLAEITSALRRTESLLTEEGSALRIAENALRLKQASARLTPRDMVRRGEYFRAQGVAMDCLIGGTGETFVRVKIYEGKCALRAGAKELTVRLTPSLIASNQFQDLRKELKRIRRALGKAVLKARIEEIYPYPVLSRLAKLCSEVKMQYFSIPYFEGCEKVLIDLSGGCQLEVSGVETLPDLKKTTGAGMGRTVSTRAFELYREWLDEVADITVEEETQVIEEKVETPLLLPAVEEEEESAECS